MTHRVLKERFTGAILGCAVGDALGAPFEGVGANKLFQDSVPDYAPITGFPRGQYTDDTQMTLAIVKAVLEDGEIRGKSVAEKFAQLWRSGEIVGPGASCSEAMWRYIRGEAGWDECGTAPGRAGNGTAMRAGPIGLWDYDAPEKLVEDATAVSVITHTDERAVAGAIAVAVAVAYVVQRDEILVDDFVLHVSPSVLDQSADLARAVNKLPALMEADESEAMHTIVNEGWNGHDASFGVTPFVIPTVLASFYAFLKHPGDFCAAVTTVINMGGDVDSTGAITGAISGAFNGVYGIPRHLREGVKDSLIISDLGAGLFNKKAGGCLSE
jgi:ADP-ribosylglycohydrolase